jgi:1,4-alpha-glucan branching enzyme
VASTKKQQAKRRTGAKGRRTFACEIGGGASQVCLAGDFNNWDPVSIRMAKRNGVFRKRMQLEPGEHQYKFVVDGEWRTDPAATMQVPNGVGSMNSVVRV